MVLNTTHQPDPGSVLRETSVCLLLLEQGERVERLTVEKGLEIEHPGRDLGWCPSDGVDGFPHISRIPESESIPSGTFVCHPHAKSTRFKDSYKADF